MWNGRATLRFTPAPLHDSHFSSPLTNSPAIGLPMNADFASVEDLYVAGACLAGLTGPQVISPACIALSSAALIAQVNFYKLFTAG